jgi:2-polyprenyl-6-methoxyphenol hydroxylase-like FAD-dependent oxidoreductase
MNVLVADAGQDRRRQLAGELIHPSAVEDLRAAGLGAALDNLAPTPVLGFAVMDTSSQGPRTCLLRYPGGEHGAAAEHADLVGAIFETLRGKARIELRERTRLTDIVEEGERDILVSLTAGTQTEQVRTRMLVAADGRASPTRKLLGISETIKRGATLAGVMVPDDTLPHPGYGHLFVGGATFALAYGVGHGQARVMIELPPGAAPQDLAHEASWMRHLPPALRLAICTAASEEPPKFAVADTRTPDLLARRRAVLIGDAAGCCHPVTASGFAFGARDARVLVESVRDNASSLPDALEAYAHARTAAQRTRLSLAAALYQAFSQSTPAMAALRSGLFDYWDNTSTGADASMSLLACRELGMWKMALEYSRVMGHSIAHLAKDTWSGRGRGWQRAGVTSAQLLASALPHLRTAMVSTQDKLQHPFSRTTT